MNVAVPSGESGSASSLPVDIFANEASIIKALSVVRQAAITPETKDSLRDMFLRYVGEGEEKERLEIKKSIITELDKYPQLSALRAQPAISGEVTENTYSQIGRTRPEPTFAITNQPVAPAPTEKPPKPKAEQKSFEPKEEAISKPTIPTTPIEGTPTPNPPVASQPTPNPPVETVAATPSSLASTASAEPAPPTAPESVASASESTPIPVATSNSRVRIDEIKHDINGRVGNPVNLINADEQIGREYMAALLEAMKQAYKGGGAEALARLEAAYKAADQLIKTQDLTEVGSTSVPETKTVAPEATTEPTAETAIEPQLQNSEPITSQVPTPHEISEPEPKVVTPEPTPIPTEGLYHQPSDDTETSNSTKQKSPTHGLSSLAGKLFKSKPDTNGPNEASVVNKSVPNQVNVRKVSVNERNNTVPPPEVTEDQENGKLQSLQTAATALPEQMAVLKKEAQRREAEAKKPITDLNSPEIDAGLKQLLSEWSLFKKSGFLGRGPAGIEHPLYKKLASMPMASVVSGRFEGSTPEIKQKLSAYMTGWRYEQGILHEMGESFEHYLRRVIRKIMERQRTVIKN